MRVNFLFLLDIVLYFIFPLFFWDLGRSYFGDYATILFSTVPGILYTLYRFKITESFNFTGLFILFNLFSGIIVDILSLSAIQLLWNNVFLSFFLALIYFFSFLLKKPLHLYFTLDILVLRGYNKSLTKEQLFERKSFILINITTFIFCLIECVYACLMINWISMYGVEAFHLDVILDNILNVVMAGVSVISFFYINHSIDIIVPVNKKRTRNRLLSFTNDWDQFPLEKSFFYFSNHHR